MHIEGGVLGPERKPGRPYGPAGTGAEPGALELQPSQLVDLAAEVQPEPARYRQTARAVAPAVNGHVAAEVGERAARDDVRHLALAVVRPHARQRRDKDVHREQPAHRAGALGHPRQFSPAAGPAHVLDEPLDTRLQQPAQPGVPGHPAPQRQEFIDVLVRHGQIQQRLGQLVRLRQLHPRRSHPEPPSSGQLYRLRVHPGSRRCDAMRTGSEPTTARSPLRLRFWLSLWGLVWAAGARRSSPSPSAPAGQRHAAYCC